VVQCRSSRGELGGTDVGEDATRGPLTLAHKIDHLFRAVHPRGRGEYTLEEVVEGIRQRGGPTISVAYLWQLRRGLKDNPTKHHLQALSDFFGVSPAYFFDDDASTRIDAQLDLLMTLRDASIRNIALRASGISEQSLRMITDIIENVRRMEHLPDPDAPGRRRGRPPRRPAADIDEGEKETTDEA
jgi:transcriptional regulator with XRE-family HTH domain